MHFRGACIDLHGSAHRWFFLIFPVLSMLQRLLHIVLLFCDFIIVPVSVYNYRLVTVLPGQSDASFSWVQFWFTHIGFTLLLVFLTIFEFRGTLLSYILRIWFGVAVLGFFIALFIPIGL
jgi:hypothetical protein